MGNMDENGASIMMLYGNQGSAFLVRDTFTDTNGTSLDAHTPNVRPGSNAWVEYSGTWEIQSNKVTQQATGNAQRIAAIDSGQAGVDIEATFDVTSAADSGFCARVTNNSNYYAVPVDGSINVCAIWKNVAGEWTQLAGNLVVTHAAGDVWRLNCNGNTLTLYQNETQRLQATDTAFPTQTIHGIRHFTGGQGTFTVDDFTITQL